MPYETLGDFITTNSGNNDYHLFTERQEIKVLFYTDQPGISSDDTSPLGVSHLLRLLDNHQPAFAKVSVTLRNRNTCGHASLKLHEALKEQNYDELWLFGYYQQNTDKYVSNLGGPQNELDTTEVDALKEWMRAGGVLITGDHSNVDVRPGTDPNDHSKYLNLGRALGRHVPRAGQLRRWEGPPTSFSTDSFNTQVNIGGGNPDNDKLQKDNTPQQIHPVKFPPLDLPHPLFLGRYGVVIRVFPDHNHEGQIIIPKPLNDEWGAVAEGWKPKPQIVAYGTDNRPPTPRPPVAILAAYDGDPVPLGRIVADSTWHHYFNLNLSGFMDTSEGSVSDLLGQFYSNLAVWLAPLEKRRAMARAMFWWLANHPLVNEEPHGDILAIGRVARSVLANEATLCEIHELLQVLIPMTFRPRGEMLNFPPIESGSESLPPQELVLGNIVLIYHQALAAIAYADLSNTLRTSTPEELIAAGFAQALEIFNNEVKTGNSDTKLT